MRKSDYGTEFACVCFLFQWRNAEKYVVVNENPHYKTGCEMFEIDDIVTYGINGVCRVVDFEEKDLFGTKKQYLVLKPLSGRGSTYYVPTDNENILSKMRKLLSEDEINHLIDTMPYEDVLWIDDERQRKECYKKIIADGNHSELVKIIKAIYHEKKVREEKGKKLHISDERFLKEAEKILYEELGYVLNISTEEVLPYIFARLEKNNIK